MPHVGTPGQVLRPSPFAGGDGEFLPFAATVIHTSRPDSPIRVLMTRPDGRAEVADLFVAAAPELGCWSPLPPAD